MRKGLEALKEYRSQQNGVNVYANDYLDIIENELKHHEHNMSTIIPNLMKTTEEQARVIEEQKKEIKALEIIRKCERKDYLIWIITEYPTWKEYLNHCKKSSLNPYIQKEEYDLLKEVLLWKKPNQRNIYAKANY